MEGLGNGVASPFSNGHPVIAIISGAAIEASVVLAGSCAMRNAAENAKIACPEIDYGFVCGGARPFSILNLLAAKVREIT